MGYPDYQTLIFDFSPMGLFDSRDMIDALKDPQAYASNTATRLPLFAKYGFLDAEGEAPEEPTSSESSFSEDPYANGFMNDDEDTESSGSEEPSNTEEEVYETEEVEEDTSESAEFNNSDSEDGDWYEEGDEPEDDEEGWYSDDEEEGTQSGGTSNLPFTKEELAEALVVDIAPQFEGILKQKAIEMVLELFEQRGVKL